MMVAVAALLSSGALAIESVLYVRSFWVTDGLCFSAYEINSARTRWLNISTECGGLVVMYESVPSITPQATEFGYGHRKSREYVRGDLNGYQLFGFYVWIKGFTNAFVARATIPLWFVSLGLSVAPTLWLFRRKVNELDPDHCAVCGYDLRATSDRCPECGTAMKRSRNPEGETARGPILKPKKD
jgi:hypothetical protein